MYSPLSTSSNENLRAKAQSDVFLKLAEVSQQDDNFNGDWRIEDLPSALGNPLAMAIMSHAELSTIQYIYESCEASVSFYTLRLASKYYPAALGYLAQEAPELIDLSCVANACRSVAKYPEAADDVCFMLKQRPDLVSLNFEPSSLLEYLPFRYGRHVTYPISLAMDCGAPDQVIKTLVELWPQGLIKYTGWTPDEDEDDEEFIIVSSTPLQCCLRMGYDESLLDFMIKKIPTTIPAFQLATAFPASQRDLKWIENVFSSATGSRSVWIKWEGPEYHRLLGILFLNNHGIKEMNIELPCALVDQEEDQPNQVALAMDQFKSLLSQRQTNTSTEKLKLEFDERKVPAQSGAAYCGILDCLGHWSSLIELDIQLPEPVQCSSTSVGQVLKQGQLEFLRINVPDSAFCGGSSQEDTSPLKPLLEALAVNETLIRLEIDNMLGKMIDDAWVESCGSVLLPAFEKNGTLTSAKFGFCPDSPRRRQLNYNLKLNQCGRKRARDNSTTLAVFVNLLDSVESWIHHCTWGEEGIYGSVVLGREVTGRESWILDPHEELDTEETMREAVVTSLCYGLLQAGIGKWSIECKP